MFSTPEWLQDALLWALGAAVVAIMIYRQLRRRQLTLRRLAALPLVVAVLAFIVDPDMVDRLHQSLDLMVFGVGVLLAVATGIARAFTMDVSIVDDVAFAQGNRRTVILWCLTFALRIGEFVTAHQIGAEEGVGEAMLFFATTLTSQSCTLAWRGAVALRGTRNDAMEFVE
ncbi:hypothetical protein AB0C12_16785 [Actinoplanes sp. NPDC048967]|uniref:hypothetical protein n=1 Tax=Actinoplanes sp. NPDC048967 TaxID=3155269 RepID=UPI0034007A7C